MNKNELRTYFKEQRAALSEQERLRRDDLLLIQFQRVELLPSINVLLSYWPFQQSVEVNTHLMTDFLLFRMPGIQLAYPVANLDNYSMQLQLVNDDTSFQLNKYGIAEPKDGIEIKATDIDMVFVPLLAFDKKGYRVGYGKGFYDRLLSSCREDVHKIGFSFFEPVDAIDDVNEFDVPLTTAITPNVVYEF